MTVLVILILLALVFGVGAVIEGILWLLLITLVLVVAAAWWGATRLRNFAGQSRRRSWKGQP